MTLCQECNSQPCMCPPHGGAVRVAKLGITKWHVSGLDGSNPTVVRRLNQEPGRTVYETTCPECGNLVAAFAYDDRPPFIGHRMPVCAPMERVIQQHALHDTFLASPGCVDVAVLRAAIEPLIPEDKRAEHSPFAYAERRRNRRQRFRWRS